MSTKTIQRDLISLKELGVVKSGRTLMIDTSRIKDNLKNEERLILGILDEMAKSAGRTFYFKAHSLLKQISQQLEHPVFTSISSETLNENDIIIFNALEDAIKRKREINVNYNNYEFTLKPLKLAFFDGFWYLLAFDTKADNVFKKFHLKSLCDIKVLESTFMTTNIIDERLKFANSVWFQLEEPYSVRLLVSNEIIKYFKRKPLPRQTILGEDADGSLEIEVEITHKMEIVPLIFWFIPYIKVLEPQWLAEDIKEKINDYKKEIE